MDTTNGGAATETGWTVGQVAALAHVTVRTLHHYDEIGLVTPATRTEAGYRLYGRADLERLHQVLLYRQLGFRLEEVRDLVEAGTADRLAALRVQRERLREQAEEAERVLRAVERAIETLSGGETMDEETLFEGFGDFDHAEYEDEAKERWGGTDAFRESARRTKRYGKKEWAEIRAEMSAIDARFAELMGAGAEADDDAAMGVAEEHRRHIDRWFYPCAPRMHAGLADMYEADTRFAAHWEKRAEGLTAFVAAAIRANAARPRAGGGG